MPDTSTLLALVGGPILSLAAAYILGRNYRQDVATALVFALCIAFAISATIINETLVLTGAHDALGVARLVLINCFAVLGAAYESFEHLLKPTGLAAKLNAVGPQVASPAPAPGHDPA